MDSEGGGVGGRWSKVHTSSLRQISTGDVMYNRVTTANTAVWCGAVESKS